ncbi:MAG: M20 family metallopeptidase [Paracoccaceae bacterium]|nr:M20 family metallopeptidase [Paracoccaceae bacterium]
MKISPAIENAKEELNAIFEDFHAHPELGFQEHRTSAIVADKLKAYGVDKVYTGLGTTGIVGLIYGKSRRNRRVGLRADMDALPIEESSGVTFKSKTPGIMHACGHDGHTTMLLGAAKHLAETRDFDGTAVLIFQPAEEGLGGARKMIAEGLFEKYPCDEIFGMHNSPNGKPGTFEICKGPAMAGAMFFDINITGTGSHAAMPQNAKDPIVVASSIVSQLQTIVSRNVPPLDTCVLSVTKIHAGSAYNVVPENANLAGTVRYFKDEVYRLAEKRIQQLCAGFAEAYDVKIDLNMRNTFDVLVNDDNLSEAYIEAARDILAPENVSEISVPATGSEDFADMLRVVPGAYCRVGHTGTIGLHNPSFVLGKEVLPIGAALMARIIEKRLPLP